MNYVFSWLIFHICQDEIFQVIKEEHKLDKLMLLNNSLFIGEITSTRRVKVFGLTLKD